MNPLCEKCGEVCLVCTQCNTEFVCSCDKHNCPNKEINGVEGSPFALYCKILDVKEVFDGNAHLDIDDKGKPLLIGWHTNKEGEDRDENSFEYVDGHWQGVFPDPTEFDDDCRVVNDTDHSYNNLGYIDESDYEF